MAGTRADAVGAGRYGCAEKRCGLNWKMRRCRKAVRSEVEDTDARKIMREMERAMFFKEDTTFNDIRDKSLQQWLDEMEQHEDVAVRGGVKLTREYVQYLKDEIGRLRHENEVKNAYLKKLREKR